MASRAAFVRQPCRASARSCGRAAATAAMDENKIGWKMNFIFIFLLNLHIQCAKSIGKSEIIIIGNRKSPL